MGRKARQEQAKREAEELALKQSRTRKIAITLAAGALIGCGILTHHSQKPTRAPAPEYSTPASTPTARDSKTTSLNALSIPDADLERLISQHAVIVRKEAGSPSGTPPATHSGTGNLYLVGQTHWQPAATRHGMKWTGNGDPPYIADSQADIFYLISTLHQDSGLRFVVGEGLGPVELDESEEFQKIWARCNKDARTFFRTTEGQLGYTLAKDVFGKRLTLVGADDKDAMKALEDVEKKLFAVADKYLSAMNRGVQPTPLPGTHDTPLGSADRAGIHGSTPESYQPGTHLALPTPAARHPYPQQVHLLTQMHEEQEPLRKQRDELNDQRSTIYLQDALRIAAALKEKDVMIVIGQAHLPKMTADYLALSRHAEKRRTLYVLVPKSVPEDKRKESVR